SHLISHTVYSKITIGLPRGLTNVFEDENEVLPLGVSPPENRIELSYDALCLFQQSSITEQ
ncbi:hypothetical protein CLOSCI_03041, partial [[Clostridium] scindens ATCC 35704]|uniref:hypothetical protein n=1 Tax=Clostridium scindens (strain JCM 10418 / VPI 12708) TaxID=29347 RepID=UPI0001652FC2